MINKQYPGLQEVETIMTEVGEPMIAFSTVENPFRPEDATHVGPTGDYWRIDMDDDARTVRPKYWTGDSWLDADGLFMKGLLGLGLHFQSLNTDHMPDLSLVRLMDWVSAALGD